MGAPRTKLLLLPLLLLVLLAAPQHQAALVNIGPATLRVGVTAYQLHTNHMAAPGNVAVGLCVSPGSVSCSGSKLGPFISNAAEFTSRDGPVAIGFEFFFENFLPSNTFAWSLLHRNISTLATSIISSDSSVVAFTSDDFGVPRLFSLQAASFSLSFTATLTDAAGPATLTLGLVSLAYDGDCDVHIFFTNVHRCDLYTKMQIDPEAFGLGYNRASNTLSRSTSNNVRDDTNPRYFSPFPSVTFPLTIERFRGGFRFYFEVWDENVFVDERMGSAWWSGSTSSLGSWEYFSAGSRATMAFALHVLCVAGSSVAQGSRCVSQCQAGTFLGQLNTCVPCACGAGAYIAKGCIGGASPQCANVRTCGADQREIATPTLFTDRVCATCATCTNGNYSVAGCTATSDTQCSPCTVCGDAQFEASPCSSSADRTCVDVMVCDLHSQYTAVPATSVSDTVCRSLTECTALTFESVAASPTSDRVCNPITQCAETAYEMAAPTSSSDRMCAPLSQCQAGRSFEAVPATPVSDRRCDLCSQCPQGYSETLECTRVQDRVCADITPPVLTLVGPTNLMFEAGPAYEDRGFTALDTALGDITANVQYTPPNTRVAGQYSVEYAVTDGFNTATARREVTVVDTQPPTVTLLLGANATFHICEASPSAPCTPFDPMTAINVSDNTDTAVTVTYTGEVDIQQVGSYVVDYAAVDASGNRATASMRVNIVGPSQPVITLRGPALVTVEAGQPYVDQGVDVADTEESEEALRARMTCVSDVNVTRPGIYTVQCSLVDASGKTVVSAQRTVEVVDTTPPRITVAGLNPLTVEAAHAQLVDAGATAEDVVDGVLPVVPSSNVDRLVPGLYTITYTATDAAGNSASATRTVRVQDTTPPLLAVRNTPLLIEAILQLSAQLWSLLDLEASDIVDGDMRDRVRLFPESVNAGVLGTVAVLATVTDNAGNTAATNFSVIVRDTQAPQLVLPASFPSTVQAGSVFDMTCEAIDSFDPSPSCLSSPPLPLLTNGSMGAMTVLFEAVDASRNIARQSITFTVVDTEAPTLRLAAGGTTAQQQAGQPYVAPQIDVADRGGLPVNVTCLPHTVSTAALGVTTVSCTAVDSAGNTALLTFDVMVEDTEPPILTVDGPTESLVEASTAYHLPAAQAWDAFYGDVSDRIVVTRYTTTLSGEGRATAALAVQESGVMVELAVARVDVAYSVSDPSGNAAPNVTRVIFESDSTPPVLTLHTNAKGTVNYAIQQFQSYEELGASAFDSYAGNLTSAIVLSYQFVSLASQTRNTTEATTSEIGVLVVTYTVSDPSGNTASRAREISVVAQAVPAPSSSRSVSSSNLLVPIVAVSALLLLLLLVLLLIRHRRKKEKARLDRGRFENPGYVQQLGDTNLQTSSSGTELVQINPVYVSVDNSPPSDGIDNPIYDALPCDAAAVSAAAAGGGQSNLAGSGRWMPAHGFLPAGGRTTLVIGNPGHATVARHDSTLAIPNPGYAVVAPHNSALAIPNPGYATVASPAYNADMARHCVESPQAARLSVRDKAREAAMGGSLAAYYDSPAGYVTACPAANAANDDYLDVKPARPTHSPTPSGASGSYIELPTEPAASDCPDVNPAMAMPVVTPVAHVVQYTAPADFEWDYEVDSSRAVRTFEGSKSSDV
jgi:hypothetical protein